MIKNSNNRYKLYPVDDVIVQYSGHVHTDFHTCAVYHVHANEQTTVELCGFKVLTLSTLYNKHWGRFSL